MTLIMTEVRIELGLLIHDCLDQGRLCQGSNMAKSLKDKIDYFFFFFFGSREDDETARATIFSVKLPNMRLFFGMKGGK